MFERLIKSLGKPANQHLHAAVQDQELQLATATLLFSIIPADHIITTEETSALITSLTALFNLSPERCKRLISRAASVHCRDSTIMAATTLLKHRTDDCFRQHLLAEIKNIIRADGVVHHNELDLQLRMTRLLGLSQETLAQSA